MADFAAESGHWYAPSGEPCYTTQGKSGERPTTLRDARTRGLFPSVTTIIRTAAAPALEKWKRDQVLLSALTLLRKPDEPEADWLTRVEIDWQQQGRQAAERGSRIHGALERHYRGAIVDEEDWAYVKPVRDLIRENCVPDDWHPERSFAHESGYGGKVDLHSSAWVLDFKTKEFTKADVPTLKTWDDHAMQLAAYRRGLNVPEARCGIVYVSASEPGTVCLREIDEADLVRGLAMFDALHAFWCAKNKYYPAQVKTLEAA